VQAEALVDVFKSFGVAEAQSTQLIAKVAEKGKAIVIAGPKDACEGASKQFEAIGMKATVRPLTKADRPSEYADSDVIDADGAQFQALMNDPSAGALVTFYAPWCGHCIKMVPEFKKVASMLKSSGIKVAAVNSDNEPGLAQSLGIKGFPSVKWVYNGQTSDYAGPRTAMELASFAQQQNVLVKAKRVVNSVVQGSKMALSKVLGRGSSASQPSESAAVAAPVEKAVAPQPAVAAAAA